MYSDFKLFVRGIWKNKLYSTITIFGFSLALMFVILLAAYICQELSVDQFHANKDRIFRAVNEEGSVFTPPVGERLKNKYPEIETYTRFYANSGYAENSRQEKLTYKSILVDSSFFRMFSFRLLEGDPSEVLRSKNSVVLTKSYALQVFGTTDILGKSLKLDNDNFFITGIIEDIPTNTHINQFDLIMSFDYMPILWSTDDLLVSDASLSFGLYLMVRPGADLFSKTDDILKDFNKNYLVYSIGLFKEFGFEPLTSVYWSSRGNVGLGVNRGSKTFVYVLLAIVFVILILAFINYINLSIARIGFRAKESAIRKLVGMTNRALFRQFILESVLLCCLSFIIAVVLSVLAVPLFNQVLNTEIHLSEVMTGWNLVLVLLGVVMLGVCSGFLPAFMIVRFNPVEVVKGSFSKKMKGSYGKVLICFQYAVAMVLIMCTIMIFRQTKYMQNYDLGFDKKNIVWLESKFDASQKVALRDQLMTIPGVSGVCFADGDPGHLVGGMSFCHKDKLVFVQRFSADTSFFRVLNIQYVPTGMNGVREGVYLNRTAVVGLELGDLPDEIEINGEKVAVLGVMNDFHFEALTEKIKMAILIPLDESMVGRHVLVKINGQTSGLTNERIKKAYSGFIGGIPFQSGFMDQTITQWYERNERNARLIGYFSIVSIVLAMMGILAMATYYIQQRMKEIGVRRVNGATISEVSQMLISSFMKWVIIAFVIACPVTWYAMGQWMQAFLYRVGLEMWVFGVVGILVALLALLIIGGQSIKAANINPVNLLKNE